jgi:hypothetical protein
LLSPLSLTTASTFCRVTNDDAGWLNTEKC